MRFEFERIDTAYIQRRVVEEEARSGGKRVVKVVLTRDEWHEFLCSQHYLWVPHGDFRSPLPRSWRVQMPRPLTTLREANAMQYLPDVHVVEVVCEG